MRIEAFVGITWRDKKKRYVLVYVYMYMYVYVCIHTYGLGFIGLRGSECEKGTIDQKVAFSRGS